MGTADDSWSLPFEDVMTKPQPHHRIKRPTGCSPDCAALRPVNLARLNIVHDHAPTDQYCLMIDDPKCYTALSEGAV